MANTDRLQHDFNQEPDDDGKRSQSLSRDIESLQSGIRVDFDQKLSELADLLARFKALVVSPNAAANDDHLCADHLTSDESTGNVSTDTTNHTDASQTSEPSAVQIDNTDDTIEAADIVPMDKADLSELATLADTARFENGLFKLNSQLYRFRLELDQEMEFREEPLHLHFRQQSELSMVLQKISDRSSEKNSDN